MNIVDAMTALKDGKKIRKRYWADKKFYIKLNKSNQIVDPQGKLKGMWVGSTTDDEWELYEPAPEPEYFGFFEAVARMRDGKIVTNKNCPFKHYYVDDGGFGYEDLRGEYRCSGISVELTNSTAWFEVK